MNYSIITNTSDKSDLAMLLLRITLATVFIAHGGQKLFGWFGGYGLEATGQWMASVGLSPGYLMALLAGSGEFFGGLALLFGLLTRAAGLVTAFTMLVALFAVHAANGFFISNNGYEYALTLAATSLVVLLQGAGKYSMDYYLHHRQS